MKTQAGVKFESTLEVTDGTSVYHILRVSRESVASFEFKGNLRRVICTLNGVETFNCALFPSKGNYFVTLGKKLRDRLRLKIGDTVTVELEKDTSIYGMPMPEEFAEVLSQDPDGDRLFNELSPGDQRLMLKLIVFVKDVDKRIARALVGIELLKHSDGKFDYHTQHDTMRLVSSADPGIKFLR
jgi:bifunctional DNA-binding transcriptional regulator/antitoxin component of YhaV-PrlF toxin-antitoxin module